jgi:molecular chaperone DnaK (HSP70)
VQISLSAIDAAAPPNVAELTIDRAMLDSVATPIVRRTFGICDDVLRSVGLTTREIQAVFLAGGSTSMPMMQPLVSEYFGRRVRSDMRPDHVVALGASLAAARPELWPLLDR